MKPQDIIFLIALAFLLYKRDPRLAAAFGIFSLLLAMPLFYRWIFFTAERLTWYAAGFFLVSIILHLIHMKEAKASNRS